MDDLVAVGGGVVASEDVIENNALTIVVGPSLWSSL
jgi:hypothetical protein